MYEIEEKIENLIYEIRGEQVIIDSDLATLYKVETKRINEAVKNNPEKFPERFSWVLTEEEMLFLRSKISTLKKDEQPKRGKHRKYNIRVFTEQGVAMIATILKSKIAIKTSIAIMDAFVNMRKYISDNLLAQKYFNNMTIRHDGEIKLLQESFSKFKEKKKTNEIYFNGQIYDAYSKILDIFKEAKNYLVIIDSYADKTVLDIIKKLKIKVTIITRKDSLISKTDIEKYNKQYSNLKVIYDNTFHDRYFIIDKNKVYHCGASINRIGYKTFSITLISDDIVNQKLLENIDKKNPVK